MLSILLLSYCARLFLGLGDCGGGGNLPEDSRLGIMLLLLLRTFSLLPPDDNSSCAASDFVSILCLFCC